MLNTGFLWVIVISLNMLRNLCSDKFCLEKWNKETTFINSNYSQGFFYYERRTTESNLGN